MYNKESNRFNIWALYDLQTKFINIIKLYNLDFAIERLIINWERQKIKILYYNLDSHYKFKIIYNRNYIFIHHFWRGELFDVDQFNLSNEKIFIKSPIEYTLGNIFDMIMNNIIHNKYNINDKHIFSIIINTYPHARFDYEYFNFIRNNCKYQDFVDKVNSKILLANLIDTKQECA